MEMELEPIRTKLDEVRVRLDVIGAGLVDLRERITILEEWVANGTDQEPRLRHPDTTA